MPYGGDPSASFADAVRYLIGDTGTTELVSDAEIAYLRTTEGDSVYTVAIAAAVNLGNKYAQLVDQTVGKVSVSYSQKSKQFYALAEQLRRKAGRGAAPYAGGISLADKETDEDDSDNPGSYFSVGMMDG